MAKPTTPAEKAKIRAFMAKLKEQKRVPEQREFPQIGAFCSVKEYVDQYFILNKPCGYPSSCRYVENYFNLSTDPVTL